MRSNTPVIRSLVAASVVLSLLPLPSAALAHADTPTTAWRAGEFAVDTGGVVRRADVLLQRPNTRPTQAMPLGNGALGTAVWAASGFTAQLNRTDTFPDRRSPGQLVLPGLARMTMAADFRGELDRYDATLRESGGGMTLRAYVRADTDQLIVEVTGADPDESQTARIGLWGSRRPAAAAAGSIATLAETWTDATATGASGRTFGSLAALTAGGRGVTASVLDAQTVQVSFRPFADGSYRIVVGAPQWTGGDAAAEAVALLGDAATRSGRDLAAGHLRWWHGYWQRIGLMRLHSADGAADYLESLRTGYYYTIAASNRGTLPGTHAGMADLISYARDRQAWYAGGYWFWNLRMMLSANASAGAFDLNEPIFRLYRDNLAAMREWTRGHMGGREGICVPETMRFNGNGFYGGSSAVSNASCDQTITPSWNSLNISTGAEIGLWVWRQYQMTDDRGFLADNYPLMAEAARFLLAYEVPGDDGYLHARANAHETQWNVLDPTNNLVAMMALFPAVIEAARLLGTDADTDLVARLATAIGQIPPLPRTDTATRTQLLGPDSDGAGQNMIAPSYEPAAPYHNSENLGLETAWPFDLVGDDDPLTDLVRRTYTHRRSVHSPDWSFDAIHAARLGLADAVAADLVAVTQKYQFPVNALADWSGKPTGSEEFYLEQAGVTATALNEALVQDFDGLLRIAPAWPAGWDADASIAIRHGTTVHVQMRSGAPVTVALAAGASYRQRLRNPWPGRQVVVLDGVSGRTVLPATSAAELTVPLRAGRSYLVAPADQGRLAFAPVTGRAPTAPLHLGPVSIGLDATAAPRFDSLPAAYDNVAITDDADAAPGNFDGAGLSFSSGALAAGGAEPGATIEAGGLSFQWPASAPGTPDNTVAAGQEIAIGAAGGTLGLLVSASYGPASGVGRITYTDGTTELYTISSPDWADTTATPVIATSVQNQPGNVQVDKAARVFYAGVGLRPGKVVDHITLPDTGGPVKWLPCLHVFALTVA